MIERNGWEADERPEPRSLGLLPSGPDPVGEWLVHRQPPIPYIGRAGSESKLRGPFPGARVGRRGRACRSLSQWMLQLLRRNLFNWHHGSGAEPDKTVAKARNALRECGEHAL